MTSSKRPSRKRRNRLLGDPDLSLIFGITLISVMGVASITPAFPKAAAALGVTKQQMGLLISIFTLPGALATPFLGALTDRIGRKTVLVPCLFLFALAGGACALARDFRILLGLRFLQGLGAAPLSYLNITLIGDFFSGKKRSSAMGFNAGVLSLGTAFYPQVGGLLALFGWFFPFALPFLALPVAVIVMLHLEDKPHGKPLPLGTYLRTLLHEARRREILGILLASLGTFTVLFGAIVTYVPFLLAQRFGASPALIGTVFLCQSLGTAAITWSTPVLFRWTGPRLRLLSAFSLFAAAMILFPRILTLKAALLPAILMGLGQGLNIPTLQDLLVSFACPEFRGGLLAFNATVLRLGQTLGPLLMGLAYATVGIGGVFAVGLGATLATVTLTFALFGRQNLQGTC